MQDITNSEISLSSIITIIDRVMVLGSDNIYRWFYPFQQFIFCDTRIERRRCGICNEDNNPMQISKGLSYKLCLNSIEYWVPDYAAIIEGKLRQEWEQNFDKRMEREVLNSFTILTIPGTLEYNGIEIEKEIGIIEPRLVDDTRTSNGSLGK